MNYSPGRRPENWPDRLAAPGPWRDGQVHCAEPSPGWRCSCGLLELPLVLDEASARTLGVPAGLDAGRHRVIHDALSAADPDADMGYLASFTTSSPDIWAALLRRDDLSSAVRTWMVEHATGLRWGDHATPAQLYPLVLSAATPLEEADLIGLTGGSSVPGIEAARALLAHPAATPAVLAHLADSLIDDYGRGARRRYHEPVLAALLSDPRPAVATAVRLRGQGLWRWAETTHAARAAYVAGVVALDAHGDAGWAVAAALLDGWSGTGAELVAVVAAALAPAPGGPDAPPGLSPARLAS